MKTNHSFANLKKPNSLLCLLWLALLGLGVFVSGCRQGGESKAADASGTYTLSTIDGDKLPCKPAHEGGAPEVKSGAITLNPDGTFTSIMSYGLPDGKTASRDFSGTYTCERNSFTLQWKGAGTTTAELQGDTFTMNNEGMLLAYRK